MQNYIEKAVSRKDIVIFIKGEPTDTNCGYSSRAIDILDYYGVAYTYENVLKSEGVRKGVKTYSGVKTLPQIFLKGAYFGGSDDIRSLHEKDVLSSVFRDKNISTDIDHTQPKLVLTLVTKDEVKSCGKETSPRQFQI